MPVGKLFGGPSIPSIPKPPPAALPATQAKPSLVNANAQAQKRSAAGAALASTVATSAQGTGAPTTAKNTLLGQ